MSNIVKYLPKLLYMAGPRVLVSSCIIGWSRRVRREKFENVISATAKKNHLVIVTSQLELIRFCYVHISARAHMKHVVVSAPHPEPTGNIC